MDRKRSEGPDAGEEIKGYPSLVSGLSDSNLAVVGGDEP